MTTLTLVVKDISATAVLHTGYNKDLDYIYTDRLHNGKYDIK